MVDLDFGRLVPAFFRALMLSYSPRFFIRLFAFLDRLASLATPFLARQAVGRVAVFAPISFDLVAAGAVGIGSRASNRPDLAALLSILHGFLSSRFGVGYCFAEFLFHSFIWLLIVSHSSRNDCSGVLP